MGGAHGLLHFLLQPQREPAVGAGLPVPPPTGQSESHSGRAPKSGWYMGVDKVNFVTSLYKDLTNSKLLIWSSFCTVAHRKPRITCERRRLLLQTHRDPPDSSLPLTSLSWFLCPAASLFCLTLSAFISISLDRKKSHTNSEYNYLVSTEEQSERI